MIVETWMTRDPITAAPDTTVREAAAIMSAQRIRHLPVVQGGGLVGIVTRTDLLRGQAIDPFSLAATSDPHVQRVVKAVMASPPITIGATAPLEDAARLMVERKIGALPVVRERGGLLGILTETDALRALIRTLHVDGPHVRLVLEGRDPEGLIAALGPRARALGLSIASVQVVTGERGREVVVTARGSHGDRLADAAWSAGFQVRHLEERR